jgi:uncharacterized protein (TIGR02145 family)
MIILFNVIYNLCGWFNLVQIVLFMCRTFCLLLFALFILHNLSAQQNGSLNDSRDREIYKTLKIGDQVWMADNLNVSTFRNGDSILHAKTDLEWDNAGKEGRPAWCYYENNTNNGIKYGKLYNWYAVIDKRGLSPKGWHIARKTDWEILIQHLGGVNQSGIVKFNDEPYYTSQINFNIFCGNISGERTSHGFYNSYSFGFLGVESFSSWWVGRKNKKDLSIHNYYMFRYESKTLSHVLDCYETEGRSVRCIKD